LRSESQLQGCRSQHDTAAAYRTTHRWPLDFATDAAFGGQLPVAAAPGFSQPQPYPLLLTQQAAQGAGGWMVHVFLDADEAAAFKGIVEAAGGL
jgi:hypothetical protein